MTLNYKVINLALARDDKTPYIEFHDRLNSVLEIELLWCYSKKKNASKFYKQVL